MKSQKNSKSNTGTFILEEGSQEQVRSTAANFIPNRGVPSRSMVLVCICAADTPFVGLVFEHPGKIAGPMLRHVHFNPETSSRIFSTAGRSQPMHVKACPSPITWLMQPEKWFRSSKEYYNLCHLRVQFQVLVSYWQARSRQGGLIRLSVGYCLWCAWRAEGVCIELRHPRMCD